ncbi:MAG: relaxase/mobilization nuclease domain-containing protein [Oscillibacter sp.]|nr:relaxase/mobilization nuclease domain-containing protein [Oscillibacter sp.]
MAYDKIIVIHSRLDHCLDYTLNEEKTDLRNALDYGMNPAKARLVTGINCDAENAHREMQATKRRWDKRGGILGYHIVHSFAPGEVTAEEAHEAGVEFARRLLGDRYEAVVSTHTDRDHLHCHIVFNSVSFMDGKKYRSDFVSYFDTLRETSNAVSRERGLSVIDAEGHGKHYAEWDAERTGKATISGLVRQDIDAAIRESFTFESFLSALRRQGYTIKYGENIKHTAITPPGGKRAFRLDSLGDGYSEVDIRSRLANLRSGEVPVSPALPMSPIIPKRYRVRSGNIRQRPRKKLRGFRALYVYYLYLLGGPRRRQRRPPPFSVRAEVTKLHQYQRQFSLLQKYGIDSDTQLSMLEDALQAQIDALTDSRKELYRQRRAGWDVEAEIAAINGELRQLRRELKTCGRIEADIPRVRQQVQLCREQETHAPEKDRKIIKSR